MELLFDETINGECKHVPSVVFYDKMTLEQTLYLFCDTSLDDYGFTISGGPDRSVLWEGSQRRKRRERN